MSDPYAGATAGATNRSSRLDHVLATLLRQAPDLEAASVVSFDGLPMASALPPGMDEDRVAAMSAALLSLGERAAQGLGRGELSQVYVEGDNGTVFLVSADDEAVLVAVGRRGAKVGLMLFEVKQAAQAVADSLRSEPDVFQQPLVAVAPPAPVPEPAAVPEPAPAPAPAVAVAPVAPEPRQPVAEPIPVFDDRREPSTPIQPVASYQEPAERPAAPAAATTASSSGSSDSGSWN